MILKSRFGNLYVDKHGVLRQVMQSYPKDIVRGIDITCMHISGIGITEDLESFFAGFLGVGSSSDRKHKVLWID
jgi:hypothetical protein